MDIEWRWIEDYPGNQIWKAKEISDAEKIGLLSLQRRITIKLINVAGEEW